MKGYKKGFTPSDLKRHKEINNRHKNMDMAENTAHAGAKTRALMKHKPYKQN